MVSTRPRALAGVSMQIATSHTATVLRAARVEQVRTRCSSRCAEQSRAQDHPTRPPVSICEQLPTTPTLTLRLTLVLVLVLALALALALALTLLLSTPPCGVAANAHRRSTPW